MAKLLPIVSAVLLAAGCTADEAQPPAGNEVETAAPTEPVPLPPGNADEPAPPEAVDAPAATGIPAAFQGEWNADPSACGSATESRLRIEPDRLRFHESLGLVRAVKAEDSRAVEVTADYEGEGERWTSTRRLALSADGRTLTVTGEGTSMTRTRCP